MKFCFNILLSVFIIGMFAAPGWSQITITSSEVPTQFGYEMNNFTLADSTGNGFSVNVGQSGGPNNWTFSESSFTGGYTFLTTVVDPATTPFAPDFPNSDHCYFTAEDSGDVYFFLDNTPDELLGLGYGIDSPGGNFFSKNTPPEVVVKFPLSMGTTWNSTTSDTFSFGGATTINRDITDNVADAYGTINLPAGDFPCIRIKGTSTSISETYFQGSLLFSDTTQSIEYTWLGENVGLLASVSSLDGETNPNFTMASDVTFRVTSSVGIEDPELPVASGFEVYQNYPNPFNPVTTISFNVPASENVKVSVYNITGQLVSTVFSGKMSAGQHSVDFSAGNLPSGVYYYQVQAGARTETRQMVLLK